MSALAVALITFVCVFGGALAGMLLRRVASESHLSEESKDIVKLVTGLIATLSALVLGLLIASAKSSFDSINEGFRETAAKIILVDRTLAQYGPDASDARTAVRNAYAARIDRLFPPDGHPIVGSSALGGGPPLAEAVAPRIQALSPTTDVQRTLQSRALQLTYEIAQARWNAFEQSDTKTPPMFVAVLMFWLAAMFAGFGLFAPRNRITMTALVIGALSVATAIFLIEEMNDPLGGVIAISSVPMRNALAIIGK
jgi:hypothetical protein